MNNILLLDAYQRMLRIRLAEERLVAEYLKDNRRSFVHFYIGQEAIAAGVCMNLTNQDMVFSTHRSHGHYLAKGGNLKAMVAELYGKATGCAKGRGGSMHLIDKSVGFMGSISILSSVVPIAAGAAFALKERKKKAVSVVFVGDGAADEGAFYETINLAVLMEVPLIIVVENNLYAATSDFSARHPQEFSLKEVVEGLGGVYFRADGNDVYEVYEKTNRAKRITLDNPMEVSVIECRTYRHMAHSAPLMDDDLGYRKEDSLARRLEACPLKLAKAMAIAAGVSLETLALIENLINQEIDEAIKFANESPFPDPASLIEGVYHD